MKRPGLLIVVFVGALLTFVTFNTIVTESQGSRGLQPGDELPPFAMPLSTSACEGRCDANVATAAGQGAAGARPACEVRGRDVLNVCELREDGPNKWEVISLGRDGVASEDDISSKAKKEDGR